MGWASSVCAHPDTVFPNAIVLRSLQDVPCLRVIGTRLGSVLIVSMASPASRMALTALGRSRANGFGRDMSARPDRQVDSIKSDFRGRLRHILVPQKLEVL
jgi:hypothetical protein